MAEQGASDQTSGAEFSHSLAAVGQRGLLIPSLGLAQAGSQQQGDAAGVSGVGTPGLALVWVPFMHVLITQSSRRPTRRGPLLPVTQERRGDGMFRQLA